MTRPSFRTTKGERAGVAEVIDTSDLEQIYRDVARGRFVWSGLPEDMPEGYIEDTALFYNAGVGVKNTSMGLVVLPAKPVSLTVYGTPYSWVPGNVPGLTGLEMDPELFAESDTPVLWMSMSVMDRIRPYLQVMARCLKVLNTNVGALSTPILINGRPDAGDGGNLTGVLLKSDMLDGESFIPVIRGDGMPLDVLDLKVTDHTQNLISTMEAMHAKILEIMQSGDGVAKSSGITVEETVNGNQSVTQAADLELARRKAWADRIHAELGLNVTVERATVVMQPAQPEGAPEETPEGSE